MTSSGLSPDRVVEILAEGREDSRKQATGYCIAEHLVITARHAITFGDTPAHRLRVRLGAVAEGGTFKARPVWTSSAPYGDLAVLECQVNDIQLAPARTRITIAKVTATHPPSQPCIIAGFPKRMRREHPSGGGGFREVAIESTVTTANVKRGLLEIPLSGRQVEDLGEWVGESGAPVFVNDELVGIVVRLDTHRKLLLAAQIGVATGDISLTIPGCVEPADSAAGLRELLAPEGAIDIAPARRRAAYRDRIDTIAERCTSLQERDRELAILENLTAQASPYVLWTGLPWSGKTALSAAFARQPGPKIDAVAFFASRAEGQQENELWTAIADQLSALCYETCPDNPRSEFDRLWARANRVAEAEGRSIVLLIDGLDELDEDSFGEPIGARLPTIVPDTARIVLLGRPNPRFWDMVSPDHPLRDPAMQNYNLEVSTHTLRIRERAESDLSRLLTGDNRLPRYVLGMITVTGPLGASDAAHLLRAQGVDADSGDVQRVFLRALSGRVLVRADYGDEKRYAYAHDTLRTIVAQEVDPESLARHRAALLQWGDEWQARDWHGEVPRCLTDEYAHAVVRAGDRERLIALLTSRERVAMLRQRTGSDRRALEDIRRGLEVLTRPVADGLEPAVRAALAVDAMRRGDDDPPLGLILAYAHVGSWSQAEHLAHLAEELSGITALVSVAEIAVSSGQSARCWPLAATALERLEGIDWVDLEAERKHPMAFRPHDRHEDDVPLKHIIRAGLLGRLSILAEDVHRFATSHQQGTICPDLDACGANRRDRP